ncbi:DoxX family protein [Lewinella sp. IMCC34191]|uniref:DoxX family protein n=1 Tax=Lewinella sp. IMCC34191 TaxID=2259172 RepID=UPI000E25DDAE|nr:DoxX family protein [Lewinella sp. IMCC34191]
MSKRNKIIYWISTAWLALGMVSTGLVQVLRQAESVEMFLSLGYPEYLMSIVGVAKLLGVPVILLPGLPLLKEWAYAGYFFLMAGAIVSHLAAGEPQDGLPALLLLLLTLISWYLRPAHRRGMALNRRLA